MAFKLPPPPNGQDINSPSMRDWLYKLARYLDEALDLSNVTGTLAASNGGTGINSYSVGDILYASGTTTLSKLSIGVNGEVLKIVSGLPNWEPAATGTVTSFSFTNANGVSGVVTNPSTTPDLTITLGNITPTSVAAVGTVTGSNLSGTNTGDQFLFGTIAVSGQSNVVAETTNDTLTLVAGTNITITTDAATDSITINSSGGGGSVGAEIYAFAARHG